ncbi:putative ABC transporter solute-binding protein YclQ precursor [Stieleria maiorica]|uniref:Putative ABC transporter solute-binding protein YclQ n=1 Tax=Stieleria maiorica TaxID=2795974 RepID=A0A5B9MG85_9BACT|nr:ABC transporter substrate-binding protein [Stieleria maiorica]QEF98594.1 putative ABC transporter solute-binding protein YclQ precursor [Stieleria maiorica]
MQGTVKLPSVPRRVVTLDLASLENLHALNVPVVGVPSTNVDMLPEHLKQYAGDEFAKVGSLFEPEIETIKSLKPDLIIVGGRSSRQCESLSEIAPTIDLSTSTTGFIPSVVGNLLTLGAIFEKEREASRLTRDLLNDVRMLQSKAGEQGSGLLLFSVGEKVIAQQPATRFGIVYELVGIAPAVTAEDAEPTGERRGREQQAKRNVDDAAARERLAKILRREPAWMFAIDRNSAFGERANASEVLSTVPAIAESEAWKNGKVVYLSGTGWYLIGGGVLQLQQTIDQVNNAFDENGS